MRTLQLYGTGAATANAVAQVVIPSSVTLKAVSYSVAMDQVADNSHCRVELSKVPISQIATNGAQDPFLSLALFTSIAGAAGGVPIGLNGQQKLAVSCRQGEIIYLHAYVVTTTYYANFIFWF